MNLPGVSSNQSSCSNYNSDMWDIVLSYKRSPGARRHHASRQRGSLVPGETQLRVCRVLLPPPCSGKWRCSGHTTWAGNKGRLGLGSQKNWGFTSSGGLSHYSGGRPAPPIASCAFLSRSTGSLRPQWLGSAERGRDSAACQRPCQPAREGPWNQDSGSGLRLLALYTQLC